MRSSRGNGYLAYLVIAVVIVSAGADTKRPVIHTQAVGTRVMAERLETIARNVDPELNIYANVERARHLRRRLAQPFEPGEQVMVRALLAQELLNAGETGEAIRHFREVGADVARDPTIFPPGFEETIAELLAISHMRIGEQENCVAHGGIEACLLPIGSTGVHTRQRGSRGAIDAYRAILNRDAGDLTARWLLNVAYMTVGEYPSGVPETWIIPPEAFESDYDIGRFRDVAPATGLDVMGLAGGCVMEDFDGDGFLDLMVSSWGLRDQIRFFRNDGDGTFSDRTVFAGLTGIVGGLNLVHADYDNDGYPDVLVLRGAWLKRAGAHPNSLLRNNGDGTFADVTEEAGLLSFHPTQTAAWGDYDNDGWVDLFIGNETADGDVHPCELFRNNGDGTFADVAREAGVAIQGYVKGCVWGDFDNDGFPDLYVSRLLEPNLLFRNVGAHSGRRRFSDMSEAAGVTEPLNSFPAWFWDYNNDGWLDLFVSGYRANSGDVAADYLGIDTGAERPRLYRNRGNGTFADVTGECGLDKVLYTMGCNFGDLDNDGFQDFYVGTGDPDYREIMPNRMFRNAEGGFFQDVTTSGGFGHLQKGHGVAFGDIDNDGDQDIFAVMGGAYSGDVFQNVLFENPGHDNRWVVLKLEGLRSNRAAIGARIVVRVERGDGVYEIHASVTAGGSFGSSGLQQEIGLGQATDIREVRVTWPAAGEVQIFEDVEMDRAFRVSEGDPALAPMPLKRLRMSPMTGQERASHHHN